MRRATSVIVALTLVFASIIAAGGAAPAQTPTWSIRPSVSPPAPTGSEFEDVACASAARCFAVGEYWITAGIYAALIEQWDGAQWSIASAPAGVDALNDIACPSATTCIAVGTKDGNRPAVLRWNGTIWSVDTSAMPSQFNNFNLLACSSPTHCFATSQGSIVVAEWNGHAWSPATVPRVSLYDGFNDLTCASATSCFAVGQTVAAGVNQTLIEHWDGSSWSLMTSPATPADFAFFLESISCPSATSCFVVGTEQGAPDITNTLVERWNGSAWAIVASPNSAELTIDNRLDSVACASETDCVAAGGSQLFERWDGMTWAVVAPAAPNGITPGDSRGVACASPTNCFSVGYNGTAALQHFDGTTWTPVAVPLPVPTDSTLSAVSCTKTACFAVGARHFTNGYSAPVILKSAASGWVLSPSPGAPSATTTTLSGVSCPTDTRCFAVGSTLSYPFGEPHSTTLIERWNGTSWAIMKSANRAGISNTLTGITCTSTQQCFAVGNAGGLAPLVERWNGSSWSVMNIPATPNTSDELESVSCASAASCFAVGSQGTDYGAHHKKTFAEHWNGSKWSIVPSVDAPGPFSRLWSVSCPATDSCYAVGASYASAASDATMKTLIEHWDGKVWKRVASVDRVGAKRNVLLSVSCTGVSTCTAVGSSSGSAGGNTVTLVESLAGKSWSIGASLNPAGSNASLNGVACVTPTGCSAVGGYRHSISHFTLVEHSA